MNATNINKSPWSILADQMLGRQRPTISLSAFLSSSILTRTDTSPAFTITITATLHNTTRPVTILTNTNFSGKANCHPSLKLIDTSSGLAAPDIERRDIRAYAPHHNHVPLTKENEEYFATLYPHKPYSFEIYIGPLEENRPYVLANLPERKLNWGRGDMLEKGKEYMVTLERCDAMWWDYGTKKELLRDEESVKGSLLRWLRPGCADHLKESEWIALEMETGPTFKVEGMNLENWFSGQTSMTFDIPVWCKEREDIPRISYSNIT